MTTSWDPESIRHLAEARDVYKEQRDAARYQIARAIAQLDAAMLIEMYDAEILIDSVLAQLRAYEATIE